MGKEKLIVKATLIGAASNCTANLLLMPRFAENGASVATVAAETIVALVSFFNGRKYFDMRRVFRQYYEYWIAALPIPVIALLFRQLPVHYVLRMGLVIAVSAGCYFLILFALKNPYFIDALHAVTGKLRKTRSAQE